MQYTSYDQIPWYRKNWFAVLSIVLFPPALLPVLLTGDTYYFRKGEIKCYSRLAKVFLLLWGLGGVVQIGAVIVDAMGDSAGIEQVEDTLSVAEPAAQVSITAASIVGRWGNGTINMTIEPVGEDFDVAINVGTETGCAGEISGRAKWMGKHIMLESGNENSCVVQITPETKTIWINTEGCDDYHGVSCGFDGELGRQ